MKDQCKIGKQCLKCPWKVKTNPNDIPNGYSKEKHQNLKSTISEGIGSFFNTRVMACHEAHEARCVGWMHNQLGVGHNLGLRMRAIDYDLSEMEVVGDQHETFEATLRKIK